MSSGDLCQPLAIPLLLDLLPRAHCQFRLDISASGCVACDAVKHPPNFEITVVHLRGEPVLPTGSQQAPPLHLQASLQFQLLQRFSVQWRQFTRPDHCQYLALCLAVSPHNQLSASVQTLLRGELVGISLSQTQLLRPFLFRVACYVWHFHDAGLARHADRSVSCSVARCGSDSCSGSTLS